ncbi:MAG: recombinase family protein [Candidatus Omnitrophica bacterium]|nr:recombinase family protein [Candidatus Omnitrophota bacterium]
MKEEHKKFIYCAAYCRKSVEERKDEVFGSIENQRQAILDFIASHKHEGWIALPDRYEDNGYTGANTNRPGLEKLLNDIKERKINMVIVYKLDRLSRSLVDFVGLLKVFEAYNVTFASVTQPIDTSSSTGKLMLHILSSFAEFERELISERTKDKMGAARKRGQWIGGRPPLGYDIDKENRRLIINKEEANLIKQIFNLYLEGNSLLKIVRILNDKGYRTKKTITKNGRVYGGIKFGVSHIHSIITNPLYIGKVRYEGTIYEGQQEAIIDNKTFQKAQELLKSNRVERKTCKNKDCSGLLSNLLRCKSCNKSMFHTYTIKNKIHKYRYYVCSNANKRGYHSCPTKSLNAQMVEDAVIDCLKAIFTKKKSLKDFVYKQEAEALLSPIWKTLFAEEKRKILKTLIKEINYDTPAGKLDIVLNNTNENFSFETDLKKTPKANRKEIDKEPPIRRILILAYQIKKLIKEGKISHHRQVCRWLNISPTRIDQIMNILLLSPQIQKEIILTNNPKIASLPEFRIRPILKKPLWKEQLSCWRKLISN